MYAMVTRRRMNRDREQETIQRAESEFFPKLQQTPGFVSFTLVQGEDGVNTAVILFESQAQAAAVRDAAERWQRTLDEFGHQVESQGRGEVVRHITASK
jgi:heme-degrading monooxygenase HmoA